MIVVTASYKLEMIWINSEEHVRLLRTEVGSQAAESLRKAISALAPDLVVSTGFCGGLTKDLAAGDIVFANKLIHEDEQLQIDTDLLSSATSALDSVQIDYVVGTVCTVEQVVSTTADKQALAGIADVVDMETAFLAKVCNDTKTPFVSIRAVVEPVNMTMPFTDNGSLIVAVLSHPLSAINTGRNAITAGRAIGNAAKVLVRAMSTEDA